MLWKIRAYRCCSGACDNAARCRPGDARQNGGIGDDLSRLLGAGGPGRGVVVEAVA
ncbi:hypothetical protein LX16_4175 [Stackebrandtia albiflava]|uniref:Uncharacterized protein n=2 Tax=Stackebrandtia albiflava TaxID=406432 RepID=A0A562UYR6_9ACTN|nr:hypothetical protein LX16_4175 [Stackebrandtia albiflava]